MSLTITTAILASGWLLDVPIWMLVGYVAVATALNITLLARSVREYRASCGVRAECRTLNP